MNVHVIHPLDLKHKFNKDGSVKTFFGPQGNINHGESFMGQLFKPIKDKDGCKPFEPESFKVDPFKFFDKEGSGWFDVNQKLPVVMVEEGGCSNAVKS